MVSLGFARRAAADALWKKCSSIALPAVHRARLGLQAELKFVFVRYRVAVGCLERGGV
jgi:hypothetical protein